MKLPFAFYEVKYLVEDNAIRYERYYKFNTFEISKEDYPSFLGIYRTDYQRGCPRDSFETMNKVRKIKVDKITHI